MLIRAIALSIDAFIEKSDSFTDLVNTVESFGIESKIKEEPVSHFHLGEEFIYEAHSYKLIKHSETIQLTNQENELINILTKARGEYVSSEFLLNAIGAKGETSIETLRTVIRRIRKKSYRDIIQNKNGIGYKVNLMKDPPIGSGADAIEHTDLGIKILLLKGNKKRSDSLSYQLQKFGFQCDNAYTIEQANFLSDGTAYQYVIAELDLPDGEGTNFIRKLEDTRHSKIIILSPASDVHYKEYLYFKGILDYIVDSEDLKYLAYTIYKTIYKIETNTDRNRILVIEKSKRICEQIRDLLTPRNYVVDTISDITKAFEIIKNTNYFLVVLDLSFPRSFELISNVKRHIDKSLPFIVLTDTNRCYETLRESYKNDADECLKKPLYAEEFILKVDHLIDLSRLVSLLVEQKDFCDTYKEIVDKTTILSKTDAQGIITYANQKFCELSGYSQSELIGRSHSIIRHPDTPKEVFKEMWERIKIEKKPWNGILKNRANDGSTYIVQTYIMPIRDVNDEIVEFVALRSDITPHTAAGR